MALLHTLRAGDEQRPEEIDIALDSLDVGQRLGDAGLKVRCSGWQMGISETLGVKEGRMAEGFGDVEEVAAINFRRGRGRGRGGGSDVEVPVFEGSANGVPFGPELVAGVVIGGVEVFFVEGGRPAVAV